MDFPEKGENMKYPKFLFPKKISSHAAQNLLQINQKISKQKRSQEKHEQEEKTNFTH